MKNVIYEKAVKWYPVREISADTPVKPADRYTIDNFGDRVTQYPVKTDSSTRDKYLWALQTLISGKKIYFVQKRKGIPTGHGLFFTDILKKALSPFVRCLGFFKVEEKYLTAWREQHCVPNMKCDIFVDNVKPTFNAMQVALVSTNQGTNDSIFPITEQQWLTPSYVIERLLVDPGVIYAPALIGGGSPTTALVTMKAVNRYLKNADVRMIVVYQETVHAVPHTMAVMGTSEVPPIKVLEQITDDLATCVTIHNITFHSVDIEDYRCLSPITTDDNASVNPINTDDESMVPREEYVRSLNASLWMHLRDSDVDALLSRISVTDDIFDVIGSILGTYGVIYTDCIYPKVIGLKSVTMVKNCIVHNLHTSDCVLTSVMDTITSHIVFVLSTDVYRARTIGASFLNDDCDGAIASYFIIPAGDSAIQPEFANRESEPGQDNAGKKPDDVIPSDYTVTWVERYDAMLIKVLNSIVSSIEDYVSHIMEVYGPIYVGNKQSIYGITNGIDFTKARQHYSPVIFICAICSTMYKGRTVFVMHENIKLAESVGCVILNDENAYLAAYITLNE